MSDSTPETWASLSRPWLRAELRDVLQGLSADDPVALWQCRRREGHLSGVTYIVHFLFDDNDLGRASVGIALFDEQEVQSISAVKSALNPIIDEREPGVDESYVEHPSWPQVRTAAESALKLIEGR